MSTTANLRALREARGLSQEDLAREMDMSVKTVVRREQDGRVDTPTGRRLLAYLDRHETVTTARSQRRNPAGMAENGGPSKVTGQPLPTIFRRYAVLRSRLTAEQLEDVDDYEWRTFKELAPGFPDEDERREQAVRITVAYIEGMLRNAGSRDESSASST